MNHLAVLEHARKIGAIRTHEWSPIAHKPVPKAAGAAQIKEWLLANKPARFTQGTVAKALDCDTGCVSRVVKELLTAGLIVDLGLGEQGPTGKPARWWGWVENDGNV